MLALYLAALGFGCSLIVVSLLLGAGETKDFDKDLTVDKGLDLQEAGHVGHAGAEGHDVPSLWTPFLSMRFWTFGAASFGLAGTMLSLLGLPEMLVLAVAVASGGALGTGAAWFFRALKRDTVSGDTSFDRFAGEEARVVVGIRSHQQGKIVVHTLAGRVEMPATTQDERPIAVGSTVIVASVRNGVADVSRLPTPGGRAHARVAAQELPPGGGERT
jgi:hypothetical protein